MLNKNLQIQHYNKFYKMKKPRLLNFKFYKSYKITNFIKKNDISINFV